MDPQERFWNKVNKTDTCWLWTASLSMLGYGQFRFRGKIVEAHRVAWILTNGDVFDGLNILHKCDIRNCVNPEHLYLGTMKDNMKDRDSRHRHGTIKLSASQIGEIRESTDRDIDLAARFSVSESLISEIRNNNQRKVLYY